MAAPEDYEVVKFYRTSKYPLMLGRLPDGSKIFGGPYTAAQGIAGAAMIILVLSSWGLWANYGLIGNIIVGATAVVVPVYFAGMIRTRNRNPASMFLGAMKAFASPDTGRVGSKAFKFRKPHHVRGLTIPDYMPASPEIPAADKEPGQPVRNIQAPEPAPASPSTVQAQQHRAVTAIERLMAETTPKS
ncbi:hypothetical protein [Arthrobacter cryoconiti]|uniref:PrgI family protein n=1 Tax=Arthrobacter cryoconiti TaxID=748907 RepID=A0ABV8R455_9MICC|nr:hypothetical protein [Arthrobacter cryoconiti]MCC9069341.1 hypothetical protein [Arthrobacter cryoconiti]